MSVPAVKGMSSPATPPILAAAFFATSIVLTVLPRFTDRPASILDNVPSAATRRRRQRYGPGRQRRSGDVDDSGTSFGQRTPPAAPEATPPSTATAPATTSRPTPQSPDLGVTEEMTVRPGAIDTPAGNTPPFPSPVRFSSAESREDTG